MPWSFRDKCFAIGGILTRSIDIYTTDSLMKLDGYYEKNPLLCRYPTMADLIAFLVATTLIGFFVAHFYPPIRRLLLIAILAAGVVGSLNNLYWLKA